MGVILISNLSGPDEPARRAALMPMWSARCISWDSARTLAMAALAPSLPEASRKDRSELLVELYRLVLPVRALDHWALGHASCADLAVAVAGLHAIILDSEADRAPNLNQFLADWLGRTVPSVRNSWSTFLGWLYPDNRARPGARPGKRAASSRRRQRRPVMVRDRAAIRDKMILRGLLFPSFVTAPELPADESVPTPTARETNPDRNGAAASST